MRQTFHDYFFNHYKFKTRINNKPERDNNNDDDYDSNNEQNDDDDGRSDGSTDNYDKDDKIECNEFGAGICG